MVREYSVIDGMVWEEKTRCKACYWFGQEALFSQHTQQSSEVMPRHVMFFAASTFLALQSLQLSTCLQ
jgi:hypothetical protein